MFGFVSNSILGLHHIDDINVTKTMVKMTKCYFYVKLPLALLCTMLNVCHYVIYNKKLLHTIYTFASQVKIYSSIVISGIFVVSYM